MIVLIVLGFVVLAAGIVGCVLPIIPGPPLAYAALILLSIARKWEAVSPTALIVLGVLAAAVTVMDYLMPLITSKWKGASKAGIWGSLAGMIAGMIFFPPFGVIIGTFVGAVLGVGLVRPLATCSGGTSTHMARSTSISRIDRVSMAISCPPAAWWAKTS